MPQRRIYPALRAVYITLDSMKTKPWGQIQAGKSLPHPSSEEHPNLFPEEFDPHAEPGVYSSQHGGFKKKPSAEELLIRAERGIRVASLLRVVRVLMGLVGLFVALYLSTCT